LPLAPAQLFARAAAPDIVVTAQLYSFE